jgi:hypothetical protein
VLVCFALVCGNATTNVDGCARVGAGVPTCAMCGCVFLYVRVRARVNVLYLATVNQRSSHRDVDIPSVQDRVGELKAMQREARVV